jgi:hypothetical protein
MCVRTKYASVGFKCQLSKSFKIRPLGFLFLPLLAGVEVLQILFDSKIEKSLPGSVKFHASLYTSVFCSKSFFCNFQVPLALIVVAFRHFSIDLLVDDVECGVVEFV